MKIGDNIIVCVDPSGEVRTYANFDRAKQYAPVDGVLMEYAPIIEAVWIKLNPDAEGFAEGFLCTECGCSVHPHLPKQDCDYSYCPNCGATMRGVVE